MIWKSIFEETEWGNIFVEKEYDNCIHSILVSNKEIANRTLFFSDQDDLMYTFSQDHPFIPDSPVLYRHLFHLLLVHYFDSLAVFSLQ